MTCWPIRAWSMENAETPTIHYAGFWRRANAYGFDLLIVQLFTLVPTCLLVPFPTLEQIVQTASLGAWGDAFQYFFLLISAVYNIYYIASPAGATPGKKYCRMKVVNRDGSRLSLQQATIRHVASGIGTITGGLGFLTAAFTRQKLAVHDMICHTRVLRIPKPRRAPKTPKA